MIEEFFSLVIGGIVMLFVSFIQLGDDIRKQDFEHQKLLHERKKQKEKQWQN